MKTKPIDIEVKHNVGDSSYKNNTPSKREKNKGKWTKGWKDEECFGSPLDQNISKDFDFEKNLALFNKQALWDELNAQKPDVVKNTDSRKTAKYRYRKNIRRNMIGLLLHFLLDTTKTLLQPFLQHIDKYLFRNRIFVSMLQMMG